jgi:hypothetical protein
MRGGLRNAASASGVNVKHLPLETKNGNPDGLCFFFSMKPILHIF